MAEPGLKAMTRESAPKFGHFVVEFVTPGIGHILKAAGCDFVLFDMEHSGFGYETLKNALRWFEAADLPVIVRPPSDAYHHVARAMDMGAEGIMAPMTGDARQARGILDAMKYHPDGRRGVALQIAHDGYRSGSVAEKFAAANARSTMFCLIETAEGVENVEAIAAIDAVDCLWIGHFDLSVSLGVPGDFTHPRFRAAIDRVTAAALAERKSLGRMCSSVEEGVALRAAGCDFIIYSGDVWVLRDGLSAALAGLRAACGGA
jgi:2-dehydro-3-deoxyglucarate aldolase/4-hydroxy-2-oxoheptanedioate aldolase